MKTMRLDFRLKQTLDNKMREKNKDWRNRAVEKTNAPFTMPLFSTLTSASTA